MNNTFTNFNSKISNKTVTKNFSDFELYYKQNLYLRKLNNFKNEINCVNPNNLLLKVEPNFESTKTIEEIQRLYYKINNEIKKHYHYQQNKKELTDTINLLTKQIQNLSKPNYYNKTKREKNIDNNDKKEKNKPIIDYRVKIRTLEKDILYKYQDFNNTKLKNSKFMNNLNEIRKQILNRQNRLNELKKAFEEGEKKYLNDKKEIENEIENKDEKNYFDKIEQNQKILEKKNEEMINKIKKTDNEYNIILAKKKSLNFECQKIKKNNEKNIKKNQKNLENFNQKYMKDLNLAQNYKNNSKILDSISQNKLNELENMLNDMLEETKTENIQQFINYFIKSCEEYKTFQENIEKIKKKVNILENDVEELEFIINFCEENLGVIHKNNFDEEEFNELEKLKNVSDNFIYIQYQILNKSFKNFKEKMINIIDKTYEFNLNEFNFDEIYKNYLEKLKQQFKIIYNYILRKKKDKDKENYESLYLNLKSKTNNIFDFNKWDNKWDKADKITENVIHDFEKNGIQNFDVKNIENLVNEIMLKKNESK